MEVYRIVKDIYRSSSLDGKGAAMYGGRWNFKGIPTVYCAQTRSLAMLESLVHTGRMSAMPTNLIILSISIPDGSLTQLNSADCPNGWNNNPIVFSSQCIFTDFYSDNNQLALSVPSVIVPEEFNILLNPDHKLMKKVKVVGKRKVVWDERYA